MRDIVLVSVGGAVGAVSRYAVGIWAARFLGKGFPWGTLFVNVFGCLAMGMVLQILAGLESRAAKGLAESIPLQMAFWHRAVAIGFLGGLTTFSSFGADTIRELTGGQAWIAVINVAANLLLSLGGVWLGTAVISAID